MTALHCTATVRVLLDGYDYSWILMVVVRRCRQTSKAVIIISRNTATATEEARQGRDCVLAVYRVNKSISYQWSRYLRK